MKRPNRGFSLVELLVVISIIALLISILLPSLSRVRESSRILICQTQLRGVWQATNGYANDYRQCFPPRYVDGVGTRTSPGYFPDSMDWLAAPVLEWSVGYSYTSIYSLLTPYHSTPKAWCCPSAKSKVFGFTYGFNPDLTHAVYPMVLPSTSYNAAGVMTVANGWGGNPLWHKVGEPNYTTPVSPAYPGWNQTVDADTKLYCGDSQPGLGQYNSSIYGADFPHSGNRGKATNVMVLDGSVKIMNSDNYLLTLDPTASFTYMETVTSPLGLPLTR